MGFATAEALPRPGPLGFARGGLTGALVPTRASLSRTECFLIVPSWRPVRADWRGVMPRGICFEPSFEGNMVTERPTSLGRGAVAYRPSVTTRGIDSPFAPR